MCRNHYNAGLFGSGNPSLPAVSDFSENGNFKNGSIKSLCLVRQVKVNRNFFSKILFHIVISHYF